MSDIGGPQVPNILPALAGTSRASGVSKDPQQQATTQGGEEKADTRARGGNAEAAQVRDPAVSISASAAHLQVGDEVKRKVDRIDSEGRPIIVTETATFALRPDAGLKPGDDVVLNVVETGKTVAADLIVRNGRLIDPPTRLSLVIIAVHVPETPDKAAPTSYAPAPAAGPAYGRFSQTAATTSSDALASLIGSRQTGIPQGPGAIDPAALGQTADPLIARPSSSDLAALIAAQQGRTVPQGQYRNTTALVPPQPTTEPGHLLQASVLTELTAPGAESKAGLGAPIPAFTPLGAPRQVQLIDASVSRVPPNQVAEVLQVRQLAPDEARILNLPLSALASGDALAQIDTTKGKLILPYAEAATLSGELVKISELAAQAPAAQADLPKYTARLTAPGASQAKAVQVQLPDAKLVAPEAADANIKAVHTTRAFLTPEGPKTDYRLETSRGVVTITLPHTVRPMAGDPIQIITPAPAAPAPAPAPQVAALAAPLAVPLATDIPLPPKDVLQAGIPIPETFTAPQTTVPLPPIVHALDAGWPALAAAQTLVAAHDPAAGASLVARDAGGGGKLANSLLFFLNAMGRGPENWLGDESARTLAARDHGILDQLKQDFGHLARMASDAPGEWRTALLPFDLKAPDMPFAALLFGTGMPLNPDKQSGGHGGADDKDKDSQRFVVEVRFSLLGAIQLDGLIREKQFDLTLRSEKPLSPALKGDARQLFDAALGANGFKGRLNINEAEPFPVQVDAILAARAAETAL